MAEPSTRFWSRFAVTVLAVLAAFAGIGFALPGRWQAEERVVVAITDPDEALELISDPTAWPNWTVWNARDIAGFRVDPADESNSGGRAAIWSAPALGKARLSFEPVEQTPDGPIVRYKLEFLEGEYRPVRGEFRLRKQEKGWAITWRVDGELEPNPLARWTGLTLLKWMAGSDLRESLSVLQEQVERTTDAIVESTGH